MQVNRFNVYTLKISYISGNTITVEALEYEVDDEGTLTKFVPVPNKPYPALLGTYNIESVWVLNIREEVEFN